MTANNVRAALSTAKRQAGIAVYAKPVMTPDGQFPSVKSAARHYNVSPSTMHNWLNSNARPLFRYAEFNELTTAGEEP